MRMRLVTCAILASVPTTGVFFPPVAAQGRAPTQAELDALLSPRALAQRQKIYGEVWKTYGALGNRYWKAKRLREAKHFFGECEELLPHTAWISSWLSGFLDQGGKGNAKAVRSASAQRSFQRNADAARRVYIRGALRLGQLYCRQKNPTLEAHGLALYLRGLRKHGGPFPTDDPEPKIEKVEIPAEIWTRLCKEHLVVIDGAYQVGNSLVKAAESKLGAGFDVYEESRDRIVVQIVGLGDAAKGIAGPILQALQLAYPQYEKFTGRKASGKLRMFVFDSKSSYQDYCRNGPEPKYRPHVTSRGFAHCGEGFAVTYHEVGDPDETLALAVHEVAHLFYHDAFGGILMPSWYEEGFANYFVRTAAGAVEAGAMRPEFLARIRAAGDQLIPIEALLSGSAIDYMQRIAKDPEDAQARLFYPQAWALFAFFQQGASSEFKKLLAEWETALAANPYKKTADGVVQRDGTDAAKAFLGEHFAGRLEELEKAYLAWVAAQR